MDFLDKLNGIAYRKYIKKNDPGIVVVKHPALKDAAKVDASRQRFSGIKGFKSLNSLPDGTTTIEYDPNVLTQDDLIHQGLGWLKWLGK